MSDQEKQISRKELKNNLISALKNSGALNSVKAQLRKEFIESITKSHTLPKNSNNDITLKSRILYSIVYHFLRSRHLLHSASVYSAETGLDSSTVLSERDIVNGLGLGTSTSIYKAVNSVLSSELPVSVFEQLIDESCARFRVTCMTTCTQTDVSGPGVREALETQMKDIRVSYLHRREAERLLPTKTIEERMIAYQRECEERFRKDLDFQVQHIREVEIGKVRAAEQQRLHMELTHQQQALEAEYQRKLQAQSEREKETVRLFSEKERQLQQLQYETRQQMQREMDDLRHREQMMKRKCDLEHQGLKVLEGRLKELQINLETREREVSRRERDAAVKFDEELKICRKEAEAAVQQELDRLQGERIQIEVEKKRCSEESKLVGSYLNEIAELKSALRDLKLNVTTKEDEILTLRHQLTLAQRAMTLENTDTTDLLRGIGVEEDVTKGSRVDQIICLIRRNVEVEARVLQLDGFVAKATEELKQERTLRETLEGEMELLQQELQATKILLHEKTESVCETEKALRSEIDKLKKDLSDEKTKTSLVTYECQQLEKILHEQRHTIANMRKRNVLRKSQDTLDETRQRRTHRYTETPLDIQRVQYSNEVPVYIPQTATKSEPTDLRSSYKENIHDTNQPFQRPVEDVAPSFSRPPVHQASPSSSSRPQSYAQPAWPSYTSSANLASDTSGTSSDLPARSLTVSPHTISCTSQLTSDQISPVYRSDSASVSEDALRRDAAAREDKLRAEAQKEIDAKRAADERRVAEDRELQLQQERMEQQRRKTVEREQQLQQQRFELQKREAAEKEQQQQIQLQHEEEQRCEAQEVAQRRENELRQQQLREEQAVLDAQREEQERRDADLREQEQQRLRQQQIEDENRREKERQDKLKADAEEAKRLEEEAAEKEHQAKREKEAREAQERILAEAEQRRKEAEAKRHEAELERERQLEEERKKKAKEEKAKEDAAVAAAREKELEEQRKKEEDAKAIQSAREKILARRQQKQQRETALPPAPEPSPAPFVATVNDNDISEIETFEAPSMSESSRDSSEW